jgi:L-rhamnose isomerase / sugar isomerase
VVTPSRSCSWASDARIETRSLGERALVCVDTGHHAPGTNIEFIVSVLLRGGKLGAFDFNSRFCADDDLMAGAADPFQLFRILPVVHLGGGLLCTLTVT